VKQSNRPEVKIESKRCQTIHLKFDRVSFFQEEKVEEKGLEKPCENSSNNSTLTRKFTLSYLETNFTFIEEMLSFPSLENVMFKT